MYICREVGAVFMLSECSIQAKEGRRMHSLRVCCTHVVRQLLVFEITWVSVHNTALFQVDIHDAWALLSLHCQTAFMSWDILQKHHHRKQVPSMQIGLTPHCVFSNFSKNSRSWGNDRVEGVISWSWGLFHFHTSKRSLFSAPQMNLVFTLWLFCM